jgi:hypothetical protein
MPAFGGMWKYENGYLCTNPTVTMKKRLLICLLSLLLLLGTSLSSLAQCSVCTRTAEQMGERPATGMNTGILYLAFMPLAIISVLAYRWWKSERANA